MSVRVVHEYSDYSSAFKKMKTRWKMILSGSAVSSRFNINVRKAHTIVMQDGRITASILAERLGIGKEAAGQVLERDLQKRKVLVTVYLSEYSLTCQPIDRSLDPLPLRIAEASWWFLASKVCDLFDTIFLVLRKKENQLTFLHVYHHSTMLINAYLGALYSPGGDAFLVYLLNSLVHIIMYSYYTISSMGPALQPYLWWKKYLTQLQLVQFFILSGHILLAVYYNCDVPSWLKTWSLTYLCTMVAFFLNFYFKAYCLPNTAKHLSKPFEHNLKVFKNELKRRL